jgi:hypothetical protein
MDNFLLLFPVAWTVSPEISNENIRSASTRAQQEHWSTCLGKEILVVNHFCEGTHNPQVPAAGQLGQ